MCSVALRPEGPSANENTRMKKLNINFFQNKKNTASQLFNKGNQLHVPNNQFKI